MGRGMSTNSAARRNSRTSANSSDGRNKSENKSGLTSMEATGRNMDGSDHTIIPVHTQSKFLLLLDDSRSVLHIVI